MCEIERNIKRIFQEVYGKCHDWDDWEFVVVVVDDDVKH